MLARFVDRKLRAFEQRFGYDATYMREMLPVSTQAFFRVARLQGLSSFRQGVPKAPWYAAKLLGALQEDCGPCAQLVVNMALAEDVAPAVLQAVAEGRQGAMTDDVALAYRYARAVIDRAPSDEVIDAVVARWGRLGLISLAFAVTTARFYPMLKYALGHGKACVRLTIGTRAVAVHQVTAVAVATTV